MRVIAGVAKGTRLVAPRGAEVRPTSDAMRETLFQILGDAVVGARFLDLFAGSGAVGIEALSRGASDCVFVERSPRCIEAIRRNLEATRLTDRARVVRGDARRTVARLGSRERSDVAFVDPPYGWAGLVRLVEELVTQRRGLSASGIVVVQHARSVRWPEALSPSRTRRFGETLVSFFWPPSPVAEGAEEVAP
jgi:16S rRNA (guanine966-N2)-methyltransferase